MIVVDGVEMVDVREAAKLARRTPETIRRWVWSGRLAATKQGNRLLVPKEAVVARGGQVAAGGREARPSLGDWADRVRAGRTGKRGATAADLVVGDRAGR
ncbi:MAG TPA: helix-turn-helix domain-containing protein [Nocardioidaceae bacterium]|jgi:excisionase family DNA binding protein